MIITGIGKDRLQREKHPNMRISYYMKLQFQDVAYELKCTKRRNNPRDF
jgi:hypothetical protein